MQHLYQFHPQLLVRTPARPFLERLETTQIESALEDGEFMEAIYLASPVLYEECCKWQRGQIKDEQRVSQLRNSLARYYLRSTSRSTPFGLFAGCSLLHWGYKSEIRMWPQANVRHTRLDMHYLCALAQQLAGRTSLKLQLRFWPNSSLYRVGNEFRYVEYEYNKGERMHQLSAVEASTPLQLVLLQAGEGGRRVPELVALLLEQEAEREAVTNFVEELIAAQVLVSELEPTVTGPEFFTHLQSVVQRLTAEVSDSDLQALAIVLEQVRLELSTLDERGLRGPNSIADYKRLEARLGPMGLPTEGGRLLQTDLMGGLASDQPATLDAALQKTLQEGLELLTYLTSPSQHLRLADFTRRFQARYEEQEVPLLVALDNESGVAYADSNTSRYSALVHDLAVGEAASSSSRPRYQSAVHVFLRQKLNEATSQRQYSIHVTKQELLTHDLLPSSALPLPPSLGVLFRLVGTQQVLLEGTGGSSAANLLGRFAHASSALTQLIQQITQHEQKQNHGVAFAEVCHLPASRIANLLQRPHFRALEIPYLAQSTLPPNQQIRVQDLRLSARDGQLLLRCERTNQRIVPRLSTAHNFTQQALPVYQLLCDLQTQGLQSQLSFDWHDVAPDAAFWPRLTSGQIILAAATWHLDRASLQDLLTAAPAELADCFERFCAQWQLPRYFTLADGDNELLVDADNEWHVQIWLDTIRNRTTIQLKEFLFDPASTPVRDAAGRPYAHQFLALLLRQEPCYAMAEPLPALVSPEAAPREFAPGSEWLYYKLYCGQLVADRVLLEVVRPLTVELQAQRMVDTWFFVRYADPEQHLRVRWHLLNPTQLGEVIRLVSEALLPYSNNHTIWRIQIDTYRRELERYGHRTIGPSEALFCYQSQALLDSMNQGATDGTLVEPWLWGLRAVEELLVAFDYSPARKLALVQGLRDSLGQELGLTKALKRQLEAKYRPVRSAVESALALVEVPPALVIIVRSIQELAAQGEVPLDRLLGSYVHMLLNRVIPADARLHELVLYDFMTRQYRSYLARQVS